MQPFYDIEIEGTHIRQVVHRKISVLRHFIAGSKRPSGNFTQIIQTHAVRQPGVDQQELLDGNLQPGLLPDFAYDRRFRMLAVFQGAAGQSPGMDTLVRHFDKEDILILVENDGRRKHLEQWSDDARGDVLHPPGEQAPDPEQYDLCDGRMIMIQKDPAGRRRKRNRDGNVCWMRSISGGNAARHLQKADSSNRSKATWESNPRIPIEVSRGRYYTVDGAVP